MATSTDMLAENWRTETATEAAQPLAERVAELEARLVKLESAQAELRGELPENRDSLVGFSGDLVRVRAGFVIGPGAAAIGTEVSLFFTFWGLSALKKGRKLRGKGMLEKTFSLLMPSGSQSLGLSQKNFAGIGARLMRKMMRDKGIASLEELVQMARDFGVRIVSCQMSMDVMGITREELIDNLEVGGVATFLGDAARSRVSLFI